MQGGCIYQKDLPRFDFGNFTYCRNEIGIYVFGYVIMSNHLYLIIHQADGKLSDWARYIKKYTSKSFLMSIGIDLEVLLLNIFSLPTAQGSQMRKDFISIPSQFIIKF